MEEGLIFITQLNDYIFCPASIYFHNLYYENSGITFQSTDQVNGKAAHETIDNGSYSTRKNIVSSMDVYCEEYGLIGKIDILDVTKKILVERKKKVIRIYDGDIFQLYAQYFSLLEMGYEVEKLQIRSLDDNRCYDISLPENDDKMLKKFQETIRSMRDFDMNLFE